MALNCPRCGALQPFEIKCVRCDTDIAASFRSEKTRLRLYGGAVVVLFGMIIALALANQRPNASSRPAKINPSVDGSADAGNRPPREAPVASLAPPSETAIKGNVVLFADRRNFFSYKILDGFNEYFAGKASLRPWDELRDLEADTTGVIVAVGEEAFNRISEFPDNLPLVILAPLGERSLSVTRSNTFVIPSMLSRDQEVQIIHRLFPQAARVVMVSSEQSPAPSESVMTDLNLKYAAVAADPVVVDRELDALGDGRGLFWFHHLSNKDVKRIVTPRLLEKTPTVVWSALETTASTPALVELRPSAKGVGAQGALLVNRLLQGQTVSGQDLAPLNSIQVVIRFSKAAALSSSDAPPEVLIEQIKRAAASAGFESTLLP